MFKFILIFFIPYFLPAQSIKNFVKEIHLEIDAKKMAQQKALNELSRTLVIDILGEDKYTAEKQKIEQHIIKNKNRYILSIRSSSGKLGEEGKFIFRVNIKVSKDNLKALLLENHLLQDSEGSNCILPIVSFHSQLNQEKENYSWWLEQEEASVELKKIAKLFFDSLSKDFIKIGFYVIDPVFQRLIQATPSFILPKKATHFKNFIPLANFYSCDIILSGSVYIGQSIDSTSFFKIFSSQNEAKPSASSYWTQFSLNVFNIKNRKPLFRLKRQFPFPEKSKQQVIKEFRSRYQDISDSLVYQLSSYKEEGYLSLDRVMLGLQGDLSYSDKEFLVKVLVKEIEGLESLQVRYISSNKSVYLAEISKTLQEIESSLKALTLKDFFIQTRKMRNQKLEIYAKKRTP